MRPIARDLAALAVLTLTATPALAADGNDREGAAFAAAGGGVAVQGALPSVKTAPLLPDRRSAVALGQALTAGGVPLPADGLDAACAGMPTLYRCVAALHLAHNLKIEGGFDAAHEMLAYDREASLSDVARAFAPEADPMAAEKAAQGQAMADLRKAGIVK